MSTSSTFGQNPLGYEGIDLNSVANVLTPANRIPTVNDVQPYGTIWPYIGTTPATLYISSGAGNWGLFVVPSGDLLSISADTGTAVPSSSNIVISGDTTGLTTSASGATISLGGTLSVAHGGSGAVTLTSNGMLVGSGTSPISALAAAATGSVLMGVTGANPAFTGSPSFSGSVTAGTSITATLGNITATNGNLNLVHAGNKILMHASTAASDAISTVTLTSGTATVNTTACTVNSIIWLSYKNCTSTLACNLDYSISGAGTFVITSQDLTDSASTVNYLIIN